MKFLKRIACCGLGILTGAILLNPCTATAAKPSTPHVSSVTNEINGVKVSWTASTGATQGYRVYRRGAGENWRYLGTIKERTYLDTKVTGGKYWRYTVRGTNGKLYSDYEKDTPLIFRLAPSYISSVKNKTNGIEIQWNKVVGATHYRVYRRAAGKSWELITKVTTTNFTDTAIKDKYNSYYQYAVRPQKGSYIGAYCGCKQIKRQPIYVISVSKADIDTMAKLVYLEARGEPYKGQVAVAEVIINRVLSKSFPNTVNGVVYQKYQFTPASRIPSTTATQTQYNAVYDALTGNGVLNNRKVVYFSVGSCCGRYYTTIGNHVFGTE